MVSRERDVITMNFIYASKREIKTENLSHTAPGAESQNADRIDVEPDRLCFVTDGSRLLLRIADGRRRNYPVRASFVDKLLQLHQLNRRRLRYASNETAVSFFNDLLLAIESASIRVMIDGDQARTFTGRPPTAPGTSRRRTAVQ